MQIGNRAMLAVELMAWLRTCSRVRPGKTIWLADRIQHSVSYTEALLARLRDTGLIGAKKGAGGGYYLMRPADAISVAEILAAFDAPAVDVAGREASAEVSRETVAASCAVDALCRDLRMSALRFLEAVPLAHVDEQECLQGASESTRRRVRRAAAG